MKGKSPKDEDQSLITTRPVDGKATLPTANQSEDDKKPKVEFKKEEDHISLDALKVKKAEGDDKHPVQLPKSDREPNPDLDTQMAVDTLDDDNDQDLPLEREEGPSIRGTRASSSGEGIKREDVEEKFSASKRRATSSKSQIAIKKEEFDALIVPPLLARRSIDMVPTIPLPPTLTPQQRDFAFKRMFISKFYGGSFTAIFPSPSEAMVKKHGIRNWIMLGSWLHPYAPKEPGKPGVWFDFADPKFRDETDVKVDSDLDFEAAQKNNDDDKEDGSEKKRQRPGTFKGFLGIGDGDWIYLGDYTITPIRSLDAGEWRELADLVKRAWTRAIGTQQWGRWTRISIYYRKNHGGANPTRDEYQTLENSKRQFIDEVDEHDIMKAYNTGDEVLSAHMLKPQAYDLEFHKKNMNHFPSWKQEEAAKRRDKTASKKKRGGKIKEEDPGSESGDVGSPPQSPRKRRRKHVSKRRSPQGIDMDFESDKNSHSNFSEESESPPKKRKRQTVVEEEVQYQPRSRRERVVKPRKF